MVKIPDDSDDDEEEVEEEEKEEEEVNEMDKIMAIHTRFQIEVPQ